MALAKNHEVTLFNRGQTNPGLFPHVEKLIGDRNGSLAGLAGRHWDCVIVTSGFVSTQVLATATLLADKVSHYIFVSSISVYRDFASTGQNESAPVAGLEPDLVKNENDGASYGPRKALCERAAESAMPGRVLSVRPGIIIGPHDATGRFSYWVRRIVAGGQVLAPGTPSRPVQLIDVRDLAKWIIEMIENKGIGIFNTTGPAMTFGQMLDVCNFALGNKARFTWIDEHFLVKHEITSSDLPLWIPAQEKNYAGFFSIDCTKACDSGLKCRPLVETVLEIQATGNQKSETAHSIGLDSQREKFLLELWKSEIESQRMLKSSAA